MRPTGRPLRRRINSGGQTGGKNQLHALSLNSQFSGTRSSDIQRHRLQVPEPCAPGSDQISISGLQKIEQQTRSLQTTRQIQRQQSSPLWSAAAENERRI